MDASDSDMNRETDKRADRAHPVLDHSDALRAATERFNLSCPETAWLGWQVLHRFSCAQGHVFKRTPKSLVNATVVEVCTECIGQGHLERLHAVAREAQVECLDNQWRGFKVLYRFRCQQGHIRQRRPDHVYKNAACPVCLHQQLHKAKRLSDGLARLQQAAKSRGGECLSDNYQGTAHRYRFRCAEGHEWSAEGVSILNKGSWCRVCAGQRRGEGYRLADGLTRLQAVAEKRGGRCLSDAYMGGRAKYRFRCGGGHEWEATGTSILRGTWCPQCNLASKRSGQLLLVDGLSRLQAAARQKGGECLSTTYQGTAGRYEFRCQYGHEWQALGGSVLSGNWCRQCMYEALRLGLDKARQVAQERGGKCLSQRYVNNSNKLQWLCHRGHTWHAPLGRIQAGCWCPTCAHQAQIKSRTSKAWRRYRNGVETVGHLPSAPLEDAL